MKANFKKTFLAENLSTAVSFYS